MFQVMDMIVRQSDKQSKEAVNMTNEVIENWLMIAPVRCRSHSDRLTAAIHAADAAVILRHIKKIKDLKATLVTVADAVGQIREKLEEIKQHVRGAKCFWPPSFHYTFWIIMKFFFKIIERKVGVICAITIKQ